METLDKLNIEKLNSQFQKPFLKWVGGKSQILNTILEKFPKEMENYHEPFLGGGSVLLAVLTLKNLGIIKINKQIYAYDINISLIYLYRHIKSNPDDVFKKINEFMKIYDNITGNIINRQPKTIDEAKTSKESYYYWLRNIFNNSDKNTIESSALFIILNKLCYRGMFREGPNGFNVPYGHYKKTPTIITEKEITQISKLIKDVNFVSLSYSMSMKNISNGDFVYLDPPYVPENSKSFVNYVSDGFTQDNHIELFSLIKKLENSKFVLSNSSSLIVYDNFSEYNILEIKARRAINCKNPGSTTKELVIYN